LLYQDLFFAYISYYLPFIFSLEFQIYIYDTIFSDVDIEDPDLEPFLELNFNSEDHQYFAETPV